jgi:outer membrane protein assembly factor BamB
MELPSLAVRWDRPAGDAVFGAPALAGDTLYAVARNGTVWMVPIGDPAAARSLTLDLVVTAGPTPIASGVLVAGVNGAVLLLERATGAVLWRTHVNGPVEHPPLVRNGTLVVIAGRGDIHTYR